MFFVQRYSNYLAILLVAVIIAFHPPVKNWESKFVKQQADGSLTYTPDEKGNILPDFSRVGYHENNGALPDVPVVKTVEAGSNAQQAIEDAIAEVSKRTPDKNGFRGAILLKKGVYDIPGTIHINAGGIVLRGEGNDTKLVASGAGQRALISVSGTGSIRETAGSRTTITDDYVPTGAFSFHVQSAAGFAAGDRIIVYRPGTEAWVKDLKMDQIEARDGTKQWEAKDYNFQFERVVTKTEGNTVFIDNPIVMALDKKYGGGEIYKYTFNGRLSEVGVENLYCESAFASDTDENHGWNAVLLDKLENGWVRNVTSRYFGYSCVNLDNAARNITVQDCNCFDAKSQITGGRRYSFNNTGQLNLFMDCHATEGRHDYVTGAK
ncbi:MAG TPA: hypothetical protein VLD19_05800, partial [Chitinophagaceae bacterium]|nr:hypothetical protein [Chitinophagaceae bacterium]